MTGDGGYAEWSAATLEIFEPVVPGSSYLGNHASRRMEEDEEAPVFFRQDRLGDGPRAY